MNRLSGAGPALQRDAERLGGKILS